MIKIPHACTKGLFPYVSLKFIRAENCTLSLQPTSLPQGLKTSFQEYAGSEDDGSRLMFPALGCLAFLF